MAFAYAAKEMACAFQNVLDQLMNNSGPVNLSLLLRDHGRGSKLIHMLANSLCEKRPAYPASHSNILDVAKRCNPTCRY